MIPTLSCTLPRKERGACSRDYGHHAAVAERHKMDPYCSACRRNHILATFPRMLSPIKGITLRSIRPPRNPPRRLKAIVSDLTSTNPMLLLPRHQGTTSMRCHIKCECSTTPLHDYGKLGPGMPASHRNMVAGRPYPLLTVGSMPRVDADRSCALINIARLS